MYEIRFKGRKVKKDFIKLLSKLSKNVKVRVRNTLENDPYPTRTYGSSLNKVEQKGLLYCYPVSGGGRILYDIVFIKEAERVVLIHFAGDDDGEQRYLKKFAK